ncbi:MAG: hypothetical protein DRN81_04250 [Thermoproteota archaeon]|nr:MAG: hypothetical protein DRN81_04250 [Candidatus Korarchaeota archaeon]
MKISNTHHITKKGVVKRNPLREIKGVQQQPTLKEAAQIRRDVLSGKLKVYKLPYKKYRK